jgi:cytochrome bd-type quinol oxidase subunit 2
MAVLMAFAGNVPLLALQFVGIVIAVARWKRHPRVSLAALVSMVLFASLTCWSIGMTVLMFVAPDRMANLLMPLESDSRGWFSLAWIIVSILIMVTAYLCLYYAMFGDRVRAQTQGDAVPLEPMPQPEPSLAPASLS